MLSGWLLALLAAAPVEEGDRRLFPLQANFAFSAGAGPTILARAHLSAAAAVGTLRFDAEGKAGGDFFGLGIYGFLDQPAVRECRPRCARMGTGPFARYGVARRRLLSDEALPAGFLLPDWYFAFDLAVLFGRQVELVPLAALNSTAVRFAASATGPVWTKRSLARDPNLAVAVLGVLNHGGVFVEVSRHYDGQLRLHAGVEVGTGF